MMGIQCRILITVTVLVALAGYKNKRGCWAGCHHKCSCDAPDASSNTVWESWDAPCLLQSDVGIMVCALLLLEPREEQW